MGNKSISPGPCAYNPTTRTRNSTPSWTMRGTKARNLYQINEIPGPGSYNLGSKVCKLKIIVKWTKD